MLAELAHSVALLPDESDLTIAPTGAQEHAGASTADSQFPPLLRRDRKLWQRGLLPHSVDPYHAA